MSKFLTILLGGMLLPLNVVCADAAAFDQFTDAFSAGLFQGVSVSSELVLESDGDVTTVQGANIISGYHYDGKVLQEAIVENSLTLTMLSGENVIQGVNIYQGSAAEIYQVAVITGMTKISSQGSKGGLQGINIITGCDSCSP